MRLYTRRRVLAAAVAAAGGMAGCLDSTGTSESSGSSTDRPGPTIPDQATTDPAVLFRRADADRPPIRLTDEGTDGAGSDDSDDDPDSRRQLDGRHLGTELIDDASTADRLVADTPADERTSPDDDSNSQPEGRTDLSTFLSETDFERETLYLETRRIRQCFRLSLCYIAWDSGIETDYGRVLRPYDEACAADEHAVESRLFRLPVAIDPDTVNSYGSSTSSGRCRRPGAAEPNHTLSAESGRPATNGSAAPNGSDES